MLRERIKELLPDGVRLLVGKLTGPSRARRRSNRWLQEHCAQVSGAVISFGSGDDSDGEGRCYRDYFIHAISYTTSEVSDEHGCDLVLDVRKMPELQSESYDGVFCSGVLEHVDDFHSAFREMTRILKPGGTLLLGLPFRQALHMEPQDFWRFTEFGIRSMLEKHFEIIDLTRIPPRPRSFPESYWVRALKQNRGID